MTDAGNDDRDDDDVGGADCDVFGDDCNAGDDDGDDDVGSDDCNVGGDANVDEDSDDDDGVNDNDDADTMTLI